MTKTDLRFRIKRSLVFGLACGLLTLPRFAFATQTSVPSGVTLQGNILDKTGAPEEGLNVVFTVQVFSPSPSSCLLYTEIHTLNMGGSGGNFSFVLGQGSRSGTNFEDTSSLSQVFTNSATTLSALTCATGNSYTPSAGDERTVNLTFNDGVGVHTLAQPLVVQSVPFALNSDKLQGLTASGFLNLTTVPNLTQSNVETVFSNTNYPLLTALLSGQSSQYLSVGANGVTTVPSTSIAPLNPAPGQFWFDSANNVLKFYDGSTTQTLGTATAVNGSAITSGTIGGSTSVSTSGNIQTSGALSAGKAYLYDHSGAGPNYIGLQAPANMAGSGGSSYFLTFPNAVGTNGQVLTTNSTGVLSWTSPAAFTATLPISIGGTPQAPVVSVNTATTSLNGVVTLAASGGVTPGTVVQATDARLSDSRSPQGAASGDLSGTYPSPKVSAIFGTSISAAPTAAGQMLRFDGAKWTPNFVSMFDLRSTVTGSQSFNATGCLASQTLTWTSATDNLSCSNISISDSQVSYGSETANTFLAGPTTGSASPTYRAIVASDLPAGAFKNGGNTLGANETLGSTDAYSLGLMTGGSTRMTILSGGNVGLGTTSARNGLEVATLDSNYISTVRVGGITTGNTAVALNGVASQNQVLFSAYRDAQTDTVGAKIIGFNNAVYSPGGANNYYRVQNTDLAFFTLNTTPSTTDATTEKMRLNAAGNLGVGTTAPTAVLHLKAGTAAQGTSPLKFTSGTNLTTPEAGAIEFDGTNLYFTDSTSTRRTLATTAAASTFSGDITMSGTGTGLTVSNNESVGGNLSVAGALSHTYTGTTTSADTLTANAVTTAAAEAITANGLTSGSILSLSSTSTTATSGNTGLNIAVSGGNAAPSITRYGIQSAVTATGTTSTNVAGYFTASGGTNNYALIVPSGGGSVGIGTATPAQALDVNGNIAINGVLAFSKTAPTISSGGCTSPSIANSNGTVAFTINVGTACSGSQPIVLTLPAASNGWACFAGHRNANTGVPVQTSTSTTSVTLTNYAAGVATAWTTSEVLQLSCHAY